MTQRGIQSVEVGGRLLLALADGGGALALKDLAQAAGMSPAKAHPYLVSFGKLGLIVQDPGSGHYGLGPLAMQLGLISLQRFDPVRLATQRLPELALVVGQTVAIAVWGNRGATIVRDRTYGTGYPQPGTRNRVHGTGYDATAAPAGSGRRSDSDRSSPGHGPGLDRRFQAPTRNRANPLAVAPASRRMAATVFFWSFANACSSRTLSLKKPFTLPSTILDSAASGLPSSRAVSSAIRRSFSTTSTGTVSRLRYEGDMAAMCTATSWAAPVSVSVANSTPICGGRSGLVRCR